MLYCSHLTFGMVTMELISFILHIDQHLLQFFQQYGLWIFALVFLIVFVETGFVVMPFLPGDSMLFALGMMSAQGLLNVWMVIACLIVAAILGDNTNAAIGRVVGHKALEGHSRWIKKQYLQEAHQFFKKHGALSIIAARFMPFVRTFVPFIAGVSEVPARRYFVYSCIGAVLWVSLFVWMGYILGQIPVFKNHISLVGIAIIGISLLPVVITFIKTKLNKNKTQTGTTKY